MPKPSKEITIVEQISPIVAEAKALKIKSPEDMENAVELLSRLNKENDRIVKDEKELTNPINEALKKIREKYRPAKDILSQAITIARRTISDYQTKEDAKAESKKEAIALKAAEGKMGGETAIRKMDEVNTPEAKVATAHGSVSFREDEKFEVTDHTKLPWEYLIPDEVAIRKAMKANLHLPGVRYWKEKTPINKR